MNICRHCKKNEGTLADCRNTDSNGRVYIYYTCLECHRIRIKKYRNTDNGKKIYKKMMQKQAIIHKDRVAARHKALYAVRYGDIAKPLICSSCGEEKPLEAHHLDYSKPLDVIWLCRQCHTKQV